jgi:hypothetical protein
MRKVISTLLAFLFVACQIGFAQQDTLTSKKTKQKKIILGVSSSVITLGSLVYLNEAWYKDYRTGNFHFFNDNEEWLQMDKAGHVFTTYQLGDIMMNAFDRAGYSRKQKLFVGGGMGLAYMTAVEVMDGFSSGWGFSWGDEVSDVLGTSLVVAQEAIWKEQHFRLKFSYASSGLAKYNPSLLGKNDYTRVLKDYNGQTYWLSFNPFSFSTKKKFFPPWLCFSLGYSAYGMLGGFSNNIMVVDNNGNPVSYDRQRRFYLSLDIDLSKIKTRSKVLNNVLAALNILKFPAPALGFVNNKARFYYIYY